MKAYYPSLLRLTLWTPCSTPVEPCRRHTRYGHSNKLINYMYMYRNSVRLLYFVHWVAMNCGFQNGSAFQFRMEVHSRVEFQNGSAYSRMEIQNGSESGGDRPSFSELRQRFDHFLSLHVQEHHPYIEIPVSCYYWCDIL